MDHPSRVQKSQAAPEEKLKAYACELEQKLDARTRELTEALEQQTATSEVLQVISSSPDELEPVFDSMLTNATRLCAAKFGTLYLCEGEELRIVAMHNAPPAYAKSTVGTSSAPSAASGIQRPYKSVATTRRRP
jgi:hypothetical protein